MHGTAVVEDSACGGGGDYGGVPEPVGIAETAEKCYGDEE